MGGGVGGVKLRGYPGLKVWALVWLVGSFEGDEQGLLRHVRRLREGLLLFTGRQAQSSGGLGQGKGTKGTQ